MAERRILVVAHAHRDDTVDAAVRVVDTLRRAGATPVMELADRTALAELAPVLGDIAVLGDDIRVDDLDLAIVLGGDGTILRAAELVREGTAPVLGINMGHVGFLAEIERDNMDAAVARAVAGDYEVEERLALAVKVRDGAGRVVFESFALNEASIEKDSPGRMIDVVLEVDRRPLSSFGADGVVIATPTGSTAYGFSAGGPVVWPTVQAITVVPVSAHALFARPLVVGPEHAVALELQNSMGGSGVLWCDGRRTYPLPDGARVSVRRSPKPVRLARLHPAAFTDRLVRKFQLPVHGWRGPTGTMMTTSVSVIPISDDHAATEENEEPE
ncbi:NAD kinase [Microbacterium sp.]|uniref:NAD kinase n=1 Tax=Microbacterium sp. TaxID=51671 RepID=UPI003F9A7375